MEQGDGERDTALLSAAAVPNKTEFKMIDLQEVEQRVLAVSELLVPHPIEAA